MIVAEIWRKWLETKRSWILTLAANAVLIAFLVLLHRSLGFSSSKLSSLDATVCWLTFVTAACGASSEIARSRRDCTISYFIGPEIYRSLLRSALSKTIADVLVGLVPVLVIASVAALALSIPATPKGLVFAFLGGALAGLAVGPALWAAALYIRSSPAITGVVGIVGLAWVSAGSLANSSGVLASAIGETSPLGLSLWINGFGEPLALWKWMAAWIAVAAASTSLGAVITSFVRSGGDLIVDAIH